MYSLGVVFKKVEVRSIQDADEMMIRNKMDSIRDANRNRSSRDNCLRMDIVRVSKWITLFCSSCEQSDIKVFVTHFHIVAVGCRLGHQKLNTLLF